MTIAELHNIRNLLEAAGATLHAAHVDAEITRQLALENLVHTLPGYADHMAKIGAFLGLSWTPTLLELSRAMPHSEPPAVPHMAPGGALLLERSWLATRIGMMAGVWIQRGSIEGLHCLEWLMGLLDPTLPPLVAQQEPGLRAQFVAMTEHMVRAQPQNVN